MCIRDSGYYALRNQTEGNSTAIGYQSGINNNNGYNNTFLGNSATGATSLSNILCIGHAATATAANQAVIGAAAAAGGTGVYDNVYFNGVTHTSAAPVIINACGGSSSNGAQMTIQGGAGGGTDKNAGGLILTSGISTGTGTGSVSISTPTPGASGTGTNGLTSRLLINHIRVQTTVPIQLSGYTVATLPATPAIGDIAYVTDALAPAYGAIIAGGGAVATIVFYNGVNWISH